MWQMTVRHLDPAVIQGLKIRAAASGRLLEDEVRTILSDTVLKPQAGPPSAWAKDMYFGESVFPAASFMFRDKAAERGGEE